MEATMSSENMWMQFMIAAMLWEQKAPQEKMTSLTCGVIDDHSKSIKAID